MRFSVYEGLKSIASNVINFIFLETSSVNRKFFSSFFTPLSLQEVDKNFVITIDNCPHLLPSSLTDEIRGTTTLLHDVIREVRAKGLVKTSSSLRDYLELTFGIWHPVN